jgi:hypothetical protein
MRQQVVAQLRRPPHMGAGVGIRRRHVPEQQVRLLLKQHERAAHGDGAHTDPGLESDPPLRWGASRRRWPGLDRVEARASSRGRRRDYASHIRFPTLQRATPRRGRLCVSGSCTKCRRDGAWVLDVDSSRVTLGPDGTGYRRSCIMCLQRS